MVTNLPETVPDVVLLLWLWLRAARLWGGGLGLQTMSNATCGPSASRVPNAPESQPMRFLIDTIPATR